MSSNDDDLSEMADEIINLVVESTAPLMAISPLDGRYLEKVRKIPDIFSEFALIRYRREVEIRYWVEFIRLILADQVEDFSQVEQICTDLIDNYLTMDTFKVKQIEKETNHDVKAVEKHVRAILLEQGLSKMSVELVHFGLTSHDINSIAMNIQMREGIAYIRDLLTELSKNVLDRGVFWNRIPMLSRTHGQPATPCMLGQQINVFGQRLNQQIKKLECIKLSVKFGGATGNFNAHRLAYPEINWNEFANSFVQKYWRFDRVWPTTQVEYFDTWSEVFDCIRRANGILIDFARDMWMYISYGYFKQQNKKGEIGSSTMPHKINPIQFENAEGNALLANTLLQFFSQQLQLSRMQRDLVNSTLWRNVGVAFGHTTLAIKSTLDAIGRVDVNVEVIENDLENHYEVLSEALQIMLRKYCCLDAYDKVKDLFRGTNGISKYEWMNILCELKNDDSVHQDVIDAMLILTPANYAKTGIALHEDHHNEL